jgi:hypothetical protein
MRHFFMSTTNGVKRKKIKYLKSGILSNLIIT